MDTFKRLKLKNYFFHLIAGTLMLLLSCGILQAIVLEMLKEYDVHSRVAYICGIGACAAIILYGIYEVLHAFNYEKRILRGLEPAERQEFMEELSSEIQMSVPGQVVMTKNYLLVPMGRNFLVRVLKKEEIIACFRMDIHQEKTATQVELMIYSMNFKAIPVIIRGKGSEAMAMEFYESICENIPWIFHEDYDSFLAQSRKSGYRRKLIKQMKDAKMRYETGYSGDTEAEEEMEAMSEDVKKKLNSDSLLKGFLSRKTK